MTDKPNYYAASGESGAGELALAETFIIPPIEQESSGASNSERI